MNIRIIIHKSLGFGRDSQEWKVEWPNTPRVGEFILCPNNTRAKVCSVAWPVEGGPIYIDAIWAA